MTGYAAAILLCAIDEKSERSLWQLIVVCVEADSEEAARRKAESISERYECEYDTATGTRLRWTFDSIDSVQLVHPFPPGDGAEVFSRFLRDEEVRSLREPIE